MALIKHINHIEFRRQFFHIIYGLIFVTLLKLDILDLNRILGIIVIGLLISLISIKWKIPLIWWFLKRFERKDQLKKFPGKGAIFFIIGVFLAVGFFEKEVALASIMILTLGDSFSHLIGRFYGKYKFHFNKLKNYEGLIAGVFFGTIGALAFVDLKYAFLGSLIAMFFEMLDLSVFNHKLDDNLFIPLISSAVITLIMTL